MVIIFEGIVEVEIGLGGLCRGDDGRDLLELMRLRCFVGIGCWLGLLYDGIGEDWDCLGGVLEIWFDGAGLDGGKSGIWFEDKDLDCEL
jgi:hypothetical protein